MPPNADLSPKNLLEWGNSVLLEGSMVGAERGTPPGSAGLMEEGWFNQSGGLMLEYK